MTENEIGTLVVESAIAVHRELGPGLLETVYEVILAHEPHKRGFAVERQLPIPIVYKGIKLEEGFQADIMHLSVSAGEILFLKLKISLRTC